MEGYRPDTYGARFASTYDDWYGDVSDVDGTVQAIVDAAAERPVLELGVGTGRIALPLARQGITVAGIDASADMLAQLAAKPDGGAVNAQLGDMASLDLFDDAAFGVVFVGFNTFFNLANGEDQQRCMREVRRVLEPGGSFILECFVPPLAPPSSDISVRHMTSDALVLSATIVDVDAQTMSGQLVEITADGNVLRPWHIHYRFPDELDAMASAAGLRLDRRTADWHGQPFTEQAAQHVSIYRPSAD